MVRNFSPAASSVVNISGRAVESHAASGRDVEFLKFSTATARRRLGVLDVSSPGGFPRQWKYKNTPTSRSITTAASTAAVPRKAGVASGSIFSEAGGIVIAIWEDVA